MVEIYTDGGCSPNPGPGAWALVVLDGDTILQEASGGERNTTNNRMEMQAILNALSLCQNHAWTGATIYSDSQLCTQIYNTWMEGWQKRGWRRKTGPVENLDLVQQLPPLKVALPQVRLQWVKGHAGLRWNEYVDRLVQTARPRR